MSVSTGVQSSQTICPNDTQIETAITQEISNLELQNNAFSELKSHGPTHLFILQTLFKISLEDDQEIANYTKELEKKIANRKLIATNLQAINECAEQLSTYHLNQLSKANKLYRSLLNNQLKFLELSEDERAGYMDPQSERLIYYLKDTDLNQNLIALALEYSQRKEQLKQIFTDTDGKGKELRETITQTFYDLYYQKRSFLLQLKQIQVRKDQNTKTLNEALEKLETSNSWKAEHNVNLNMLINPMWRDLVSRSLNSYQLEQQLPAIKSLEEMGNLVTNQKKLEFETLYQDLNTFQQKLLNLRHQIISQNHQTNLELLLSASAIRSEYLSKSRADNSSSVIRWSKNELEDLIKELKIIPHRFSALFYHKILEFKHKFSLRQNGWVEIIKDLFTFIILFLIPFLVWIGINKISKYFDKIKENLIMQSDGTMLAIWIGRLNPFIPWVVGILGLEIFDSIALQTAFEDLLTLTPYFKFYFYYRIFRRVVVLLLTQMTSIGSINLSREHRLKINTSAKKVALFTLIAFVIVHTIESVVGQGLIFSLTMNLIKLVSLIMAFSVAYQWRFESARLLQLELGPYWSFDLDKFLNKKRSILISPPLIIITIFLMFLMMVLRWGSEFDLSKRLSAKLFRRKLEGAERDLDHFDDALPDDYRKCFIDNEMNQSLMYKYRQDIIKDIKSEIDEWFEEQSDEHSLALYGESGIGKSSLLKIIEKSYPQLKVINVELTGKFTNKGQLQRFLGELLEINLENGLTELVQSDEKRQPTLVLIDKCHQMFLSHVGGFEAFTEFLDIINAQTKNIFWCATFNVYSWQYLNNVYGKNHYFRSIKKINAWSEDDIRAMILERHELSGFKISYQDILNAAKTSDDNATVDFVETKFFRLLWEQSNGNPKTAIELWFSALKYIKPDKLRVGLPYSFRPKILNEMQDDASFIFHEILKHGDLTHSEINAVLNMGDGIIQYALKLGLENDLLIRSKGGRYSVNAIMQPLLIKSLRKKNLIYG